MRRLPGTLLLVALVLLAGCLSAPIGGQHATSSPPTTTQAPATADAGQADGPAAGGPPDFTVLYRETIDSVVMLRVAGPNGPIGGSGFVYDDRGHIVTNEHVVEDATTVEVRFHDGTWRTARVVGTDVYSDLAVVRVRDLPAAAEPLPIAETSPEPGQRVIALGSPFGLEGSITTGVVSGVNRSMPTENNFAIPDTVQTDAAINPGNSGGPLLSADGRVVGVNRARGGENVGFAVSAAILQRVVPSLISDGQFRHPLMGVFTVDVTPTIAEANGLDRSFGLLVARTADGGPAEGVLRPASGERTVDGVSVPTGGDVIVAVNGQPIGDHQRLSRYLVLQTRPGETIDVTVIRNGSRQTVSLELGTRPTP